MRRLLIFLLLSCHCIVTALAGNGKITGRVTDATSKEPLIGASVLVVGTTLGSSTDIDGKFVILSVPPGEYSLKVSYVGYQELTTTGVRVSSDLTSELNFSLRSGELELKGV